MRTQDLSPAIQDYLREAYALESSDGAVATTVLARRIGVSAASATAMMRRLAELGLAEYTPYRGLTLSRTGRRRALELLRHHRLLESFLADSLGVPLDAVHAEAHRLEHALSERLEERIDAALGFPTHDPHGDPIPDKKLRLTRVAHRLLTDLPAGETTTVARIPDDDSETLRYLDELRLTPGNPVELLELAPVGGPVTIHTHAGTHAIARELAAQIDVH